jgi:hypothetical protein
VSAERIKETGLSETLVQNRLLSEVDLLLARNEAASFDPSILHDLKVNKHTAVAEIAMPYAVSKTFQPALEIIDERGRQQRMFMWLGKCAVEVAESGRRFHFSEAALRRVDIEEAEAHHSQETLHRGRAQVFISPKMSSTDAPEIIAKQEHVGEEDSIRVSYLETDAQGNTKGRRLESLLVRSVPLPAWVTMLKDSNNIFGRAFNPKNEASALSVMELFAELELPEEHVPEGPITIVRAVLPYIKDEAAKQMVAYQLERYQKDQDIYNARAEETAEEWLEFDKALAESLRTNKATYEIRRFISSFQHLWDQTGLQLIAENDNSDGSYSMSREFAAYLEKANRNVALNKVAIDTGNEEVMAQMDVHIAKDINAHIGQIRMMELFGLSPPQVIEEEKAKLNRQIASQSLSLNGGCSGENETTFKKNSSSAAEGKEDWKWEKGICRTKNCISRPKVTEVGPCKVCKACQEIYDKGLDPEKVFSHETKTETHFNNQMLEIIRNSRKIKA